MEKHYSIESVFKMLGEEALETGEPYMNYIFKREKFKVEGAPYNGNNI